MNRSKLRYYLRHIMALLIILSVMVYQAEAVAAPVVSIPTDVPATPGGTVIVPVNITGVVGAGIGSYGVRLDYDAGVLSNPTAVTTGTLSEGNTNFQFFAPPADGVGKVSAGIGFSFAPTADGILFKVQFNVNANFTGTSPVTIIGDGVQSGLFTSGFDPIATTFTDGTVLAVDSTGPVTSNVLISANDIAFGTASIDLTARIDDSASGQNNITAAEFFIDTQGADGAGTAMTASDGTFNAQLENVQATVNTSALTVGTHTLFVHGKDAQNNWGAAQSITFTVFQAPAAPTLTAVTSPTRTVRPVLDWNDVAGAAGYNLDLATDAGFANILITQPGLTVSTFTPNQDLADGTYFWRVQAFDNANPVHTGLFSTASTFVVDTTAPATGVTVVGAGLGVTPAANGDLTLTWTNPTADFAGVIVVATDGDLAPTFTPVNGTVYTVGQVGTGIVAMGNITTFTDTALANGTHRSYTIFAFDSVNNYTAGVPILAAVSADTTAPAPVTALTPAAGNAQVVLTWVNPTTADFAGTLILMKAGSAPTGVPTNGTAQIVGDTIGDATVVFKGTTATTATITQLTNSTTYHFAVYAFDERPNYSTAAATSAIPGPPVISAPVLPKDVRVGEQVAFTATSGTGSFAWTFSAGTPATATGANATWTAPATVATSPTAVTVTVTDPATNLSATGTVNVFSNVAISDKPATPPLVLSGATSATFNAGGGDATFTWTVTGPVPVTGGTGGSFQFTAPTTGEFAGEYTIEAADSRGGTDNFKVRVPFTLTPKGKSFMRHVTQTFAVGGTTGTVTWDIMTLSGTVLTNATNPAEFGTFKNATGTSIQFDGATTITAPKTFFLKATVAGDADLTTTNGLNSETVGPFQIIPVSTYTVNVKKADGTALSGASVMVDFAGQAPVTTGADGKATFTLPDGAKYAYEVFAANFVSKTQFSAEKTVTVTLAAADAAKAIKGTVQDAVPAAMAGVEVRAYLPADLKTQHEATTAADGTYTINLPATAAATGWTVVASKTGFVTGKLTNVNAGATTANFTLAALTGVAPDVDAAGGAETVTANSQTCTVEVPAGGLTKDAVIVISQTAKVTAASKFTAASPSFVYEIKAQDTANANLAAADIKLILITLPFNLTTVKPGDLEANRFTIFTAATLADLEAGKVTAVPAANIISTDYVGDGTLGSVTFFVDHLSFFGVGVGSGATGEAPGSGCFIATAAYGSYLEEHVQILRNFRDTFLMPSSMGRAFVAFYYRYSPPVADFIARHDTLRAAVRLGLAPVVAVSFMALHTTGAEKLLLLVLLVGFIPGMVVMVRRFRKVRTVA